MIPNKQSNQKNWIKDPQLNDRSRLIGSKSRSASKDNIFLAHDFIEKPDRDEAPSNLAIASRYVFTPQIFDYLDTTARGKNNEIQLTDAMRQMVKEQAMYGLQFDGTRYDIGNKLDFIKTNLIYGLDHEEIGPRLREWLLEFTSEMK